MYQRQKTRLLRRVCCAQLVLYLGRCNFSTLLVKREHHGDSVSKGQVIPRKVESVVAFVRPDRADARPDLLPVLVFARVPAVVEDIGWGVRHRGKIIDTVSSVGDWQGASMCGSKAQPANLDFSQKSTNLV
jgi:hypothetical protein